MKYSNESRWQACAVSAALRHAVLRRSWDEIAAGNGFAVLIDGIHLSDRAADAAAGLVAGFLRADAGAR